MPHEAISRREAVGRLAAGAVGLTAGCALGPSPDLQPPGTGRLSARPRPGAPPAIPGLTPLLLDTGRDGVLYVPPGIGTANAIPLVLILHGAGGSARPLQQSMQQIADDTGCALLVPDSRGPTWDVVSGAYGADATFIDQALDAVFSRCAVNPARIAIAGFSDGASCALGLGRVNGDLFQRVIAFSPGFLPAGQPAGRPPIFITHGTADQVLPLEQTSRVIVENMSAAGYDVTFHTFDGGHAIPGALAREAFALVSGLPPSG